MGDRQRVCERTSEQARGSEGEREKESARALMCEFCGRTMIVSRLRIKVVYKGHNLHAGPAYRGVCELVNIGANEWECVWVYAHAYVFGCVRGDI